MKLRILLASVLIAALTLLTVGSVEPVHADVNNFTITNFHADYTLTNNDPQGELTIKESLTVMFTDNNHGILRSLPKTYKGKSLHLKVLGVRSPSGAPASYTSYGENDNEVLKIGDPNRTVTGPQSYEVEYRLQNVISFYDNHDELYWDINGDQWNQPFSSVDVTLATPNDKLNNNVACYTGAFGAVIQNCAISMEDGKVAARTNGGLSARQALTIVTGFKKGYFNPPTLLDNLKDNLHILLGVFLPPLLFGGWAFKRWLKFGKDRAGRGVVVPEYSPPNKLSPLEAGMIYDYRIDTKDVSATIIDLAVRGYIVIVEEKQKKILKDKTNYSLKLLKSDISQLNEYEKAIINGIFSSLSSGAVVEFTSLKNSFYKVITKLQKDVPANLTTAGYFDGDPTKAGSRMYVVAAVLFFGAWFIRSWLTVGLLLSSALVGLFAALMTKRSAKGVAAKESIEGLKLFLNVAEKDRIAMLQSADAKYVPKPSEPKKTVELFEKLLPFAIVLGVEKTWAKQFEDIYTTPPEWYRGNWSSFNSVYLASSLNNSFTAMNTNFSAPSSSGSSGFGGGGFSGGGGGGGGGGGW